MCDHSELIANHDRLTERCEALEKALEQFRDYAEGWPSVASITGSINLDSIRAALGEARTAGKS